MPDIQRRDFLTGVLACGTLTAAATYLLPGGTQAPAVELNLVSGHDSTGARELLIDMWNQANPRTRVRLTDAGRGTEDQKRRMISDAGSGAADIVNLDTIDIPEFVDRDLIVPIELDDDDLFLDRTISASQMDNDPGRYWAAPFNTDVGVLFERLAPGAPQVDARSLAEVIDHGVRDRSQGLIGQLSPTSSASDEAFVVNILEHALSRDDSILDGDGMPAFDLPRWQKALDPLRVARKKGRITLAGSEENSLEIFTSKTDRRFMRNWPVQYRVMQQNNDPDVRAGRISVHALSAGILGGRSLAVVRESRHQARAVELIRFLTGDEAQKVLAAHGLLPTRITAYDDPNLTAFIPHLEALRGAVENARPRPVHRNYSTFSDIVADHAKKLLVDDIDLPSKFIDDMRAALS